MAERCSKCGRHVAELWRFCPSCGATNSHEHQQNLEPPEHVPARGAFSGLAIGMLVAPILVIAGTMVCLTGWGIFIGIPMILLGIFAPLAGPLFGMDEHPGKCPSCGTVVSKTDGRIHHCPACDKEFEVKARQVLKAG
jgi:predicted amidophosphoribosyltransferase